MQFFCFLPQIQLSLPDLAARARIAEQAGFTGLALMDHLAPPAAVGGPMTDAMVAATWIAAHTDRLRIGHLVLCDAFRHPAIVAKQAVSLDHASGGRFELGLGSGSVPVELVRFGVTDASGAERTARLDETLEVVRALWSGEKVDFQGRFHRLRGARQQPAPLGSIPIVVGGSGPRTLEVVARHADWWNCPLYALDQLDDLRPAAGGARISIQQLLAFAPTASKRSEIAETANRRFAWAPGGVMVGDVFELRDYFAGLHGRGVERAYVWFADFAAPETLAGFGDAVIASSN